MGFEGPFCMLKLCFVLKNSCHVCLGEVLSNAPFCGLECPCFGLISWRVLTMIYVCFSLVLESLGAFLGHFGPLRFGWHSFGLTPFIGFKCWSLLYALLACFVWFGIILYSFSELSMFMLPCMSCITLHCISHPCITFCLVWGVNQVWGLRSVHTPSDVTRLNPRSSISLTSTW